MTEEQEEKSAVAKALDEAHIAYTERNPLSKRHYEYSLQHLSGANTRTVLHANPFPLVFGFASGPTLTSVDGHTYVDLLNDYGSGIFGHSNPRIRTALDDALRKGWSYGGNHVKEKELARLVVEKFGSGGIELIRFTNSGTEANTMALAAATQITKRSKVLVFTGGYHGSTLNFHQGREKKSEGMTANLPHDWVLAPYNNIEETASIVRGLPPQSLAAILVEPLQGSGGCRPGTPEFLRFLRQTADSEGCFFIVDEVMTSRLGHHGHLARLGLRADMMTLGKHIGGGMPFGAFGGRRDIMQIFNPIGGPMAHAGTFNNNALSMAAGSAGFQLYTSDEVDMLNVLGTLIKEGLAEALINHGIYAEHTNDRREDIIEIDSFSSPTKVVGTETGRLPRMFVTGHGSLLSVRFSGPDAESWSELFYHHMLRNGLYLSPRGFISLSLSTNAQHWFEFLPAFEAFLEQYGGLLLSGDDEGE